MQRFPLKDKHPLFFALLWYKAIIMLILATFLFFGDPVKVIAYTSIAIQQHEVSNLTFWAILFLINALLFIYGALFNIHWGRRGLIMGALLGGFWAYGFWIAFFNGLVNGVSAPLLWTLYTLNCVSLSREPAMNPISFASNMAARNDDSR